MRTRRLHATKTVVKSILVMVLPAALFCGAASAGAHAPVFGTPGSPSAVSGSATHTTGAPPPQANARIDGIVAAMSDSSTWGHPDLFGEFSGMRLYSEGRYKDAMKYFRIGARYADKPSQLAIGLMYANGRGVDRDPVKACAWLALAAQRKYPNFIATRNRICDALTSAQHARAETELAGLLPVYGDKAAKPRMAFALRQARMQMTGSRTGFNYGIQNMSVSSLKGTPPVTDCNAPTMPGTSVAGCGGTNFWNADRWDPQQYFAARDAQFRATVMVGKLQDEHKASVSPGAGHTVRNAPPGSAARAGH